MMKNFDSVKRTKPVKHLVIHSFALTPQKMFDTLYQYGLSVHYLIESDGKIHQLVPEENVAWHAGPSFWAGDTGLNWTSVGIELEHLGFGQTDFSEKQLESLTELAKEIIVRQNIRPENVIAHSDIAPEAKMDPGRGFSWKKMAKNGIGLWYDLKDADKMANLDVSELLSIIGYPTKGRALEASSFAFRQRFMPEKVPVDNEIETRGQAMFQARQVAAKLLPEEREKALAKAPAIYPPNDGTYLTDPDFIRGLRAVAYTYQQARKK